jgi:citrate lyase subunit alpha/citrate CoA-transferase
LRRDLIEKLSRSTLPLRKIEDIQRDVFELCGGEPEKPNVSKENIIAIVDWVDGTVLDSIYPVR